MANIVEKVFVSEVAWEQQATCALVMSAIYFAFAAFTQRLHRNMRIHKNNNKESRKGREENFSHNSKKKFYVDFLRFLLGALVTRAKIGRHGSLCSGNNFELCNFFLISSIPITSQSANQNTLRTFKVHRSHPIPLLRQL